MTPRLYPIGQQDFPGIINEGKVYVDKTMHALRMITTNKYYFLSRPRRFGKSLFISTLETIFLGKRDIFKGMYIHDRWQFDIYPIIRISFSNIGYRTQPLIKAIANELEYISRQYEIEMTTEKEDISNYFRELIQKLNYRYQKGVVILIDEYDKPLIDYLDKENLHKAIENRGILKTFYSVLKDADPYLKLVFITGVSKFSKVSIFSDLNNLIDISMDLAYNEICGISQQELEDNFAEELKLYDKEKIKQWYNGYKWHAKGNSVYNPFSTLSFFYKHGDFENYWYSTGTPTFLMKLCRAEKIYDVANIKINSFSLRNFDIEHLQAIPIMFQTGYLTLSSHDAILDFYKMDYPNAEVRASYIYGLMTEYMSTAPEVSTSILSDLRDALKTYDATLLKSAFNDAFAQIPYDLWEKDNEHFYHAIVHLLFSLLGVYIHSEVHTKNGRADAIVELDEGIYCLEFKLDKSAQQALDQITTKGYTEKYKHSDKPIHKIGINFSSKNKAVEEVLWEMG